jgi:outer membrane cobalamin receptor
MTVLIAALLLSAAVSPPPNDDEDKPHGARPSIATPNADADDEKPKAGTTPQPASHDADDDQEGGLQPNTTIVVTAHRLDTARTQIDAGLGATVYSLTNDTIENRPGGETGSVADILAQAPGVTLSGRTLNVRGAPANQVRINNVIVPEAISDPADQLSSRLAETTRLITGTLPAQFGFAPAGVISITTKNGLYQHGGQAELFAGSDGMLEPALEWAGSVDNTSLFASGSMERDRSTLGDILGNTARDRRLAVEGLGFADHVIDDENRVSVIFGGSHERHRFGATSVGTGTEIDGDAYGVATYQHTDGGLTLQASAFGGIASDEARFIDKTRERRSSWGTQIDGSDAIGASHTLRFGLLATRATVQEIEPLSGRSSAARTSFAIYAQDEWKLLPTLTFNPGARIEWLRGLGSPAKAEPRASLVWASASNLTAHVGYARYASAPPLGERPAGAGLPDERDDYFDAGFQQKMGAFTVGLDGYRRSARNYIAEHQTVGSAIPMAFGFKRARIKGLELSGTYAQRGTTAWANMSLAKAEAKTITGGEAIFSFASIAAAADRYVPLASDRPFTMSAGLTQRFGKLSLSGDALVSSGTVRTLRTSDPNGDRHSNYAVFGLAAVYHATIAGHAADFRLDLTNLTNAHYTTRDATNLEGGWTHWARSRAITIGIEQGI